MDNTVEGLKFRLTSDEVKALLTQRRAAYVKATDQAKANLEKAEKNQTPVSDQEYYGVSPEERNKQYLRLIAEHQSKADACAFFIEHVVPGTYVLSLTDIFDIYPPMETE